MNYSKPEVKTLGEAKTVIENHVKLTPTTIDSPAFKALNPAYDLDE
jgi:hypothetical protein